MSLAAALLVALAILVAPAAAQDPTPTQTPAPERSEEEKDVYRDYRRDGVIDACDHERRTLREVLDELPPEADVDNPDLRPALEAGIEQHKDGDCDEPEPTATPSPTATATPAPTATAAPTTAPDSGSVDPVPPSTGGGNTPTPPSADDVRPLSPDVTPVPPATTPVPAVPAPAEPSGPEVTPSPVYANADDSLPPSLLVVAALLALVALLALAYAAASRFGWAERRLAGPRRAFREATFRIGGTWGDFADWLRPGR